MDRDVPSVNGCGGLSTNDPYHVCSSGDIPCDGLILFGSVLERKTGVPIPKYFFGVLLWVEGKTLIFRQIRSGRRLCSLDPKAMKWKSLRNEIRSQF
jgi:hypothetical protein